MLVDKPDGKKRNTSTSDENKCPQCYESKNFKVSLFHHAVVLLMSVGGLNIFSMKPETLSCHFRRTSAVKRLYSAGWTQTKPIMGRWILQSGSFHHKRTTCSAWGTFRRINTCVSHQVELFGCCRLQCLKGNKSSLPSVVSFSQIPLKEAQLSVVGLF